MIAKRTSRIKVLFLAALFLLLSGMVTTGAAAGLDVPVGPDRPVTVMTRNMYLGADLGPIFAAAASGDRDDTILENTSVKINGITFRIISIP